MVYNLNWLKEFFRELGSLLSDFYQIGRGFYWSMLSVFEWYLKIVSIWVLLFMLGVVYLVFISGSSTFLGLSAVVWYSIFFLLLLAHVLESILGVMSDYLDDFYVYYYLRFCILLLFLKLFLYCFLVI